MTDFANGRIFCWFRLQSSTCNRTAVVVDLYSYRNFLGAKWEDGLPLTPLLRIVLGGNEVLLLPSESLLHNFFLSCSSDRHLSKPILIIQTIEILLTHSVVVNCLLLLSNNGRTHLLPIIYGIELRLRYLVRFSALVYWYLLHVIRHLVILIAILWHFYLPLLVDFTLRG